MILISTIHNYLVNGLSLPLGKEVTVTDEESVYLLTLEGVCKAKNELLQDKETIVITKKELPNIDKDK